MKLRSYKNIEEMVLTLFENWDSVQNFAQIADNAYGTAEQKMEAFTDSVEAAQNRLSTAVEQWALFFDGAEVMKSFYNVVSDVIENLDLFITVVGGFAVLANIQKILPVLAGGLSSFTNKIVSFGNILSNVRGPAGQEKGEGFSKTFWSSMDSEFIYQQQQYYGKRLQSLTKVLGEQEQQGLLSVQNALMNNKSQEKAILADILLTTNKEQLAQKLLLGIGEENRSAIVNGMLSTLRTEELTALRQKVRQDLEAAWQTDQVTQEQVDLEIATRLLTDRYKEEAGQISRNLKASSKNSVGKSLLSSLGTLAAGAGSAYGYGAIGEYLGGDRGKTIGSLLGGTAGSAIIGSFVNNVVTNGLKGALTGMSGGAKFGVAGAIAGAVGGIALGVWQANEQKKLEEAAEKFQEINEELKTMQSSLADASKFDELVNGVDKFGNNVSLTDEEYQEFLDISNSLAQVFPSLVVGVDEFGNRLVGTEGEVNAVSDAIDGLLERQRHLANQALLNDDLLEESFKTAKKQYQNAQEDAEYAEKAYERLGLAQVGVNALGLNNNTRSEELAKRLKAAGIDADNYEDD